MTTENIFLDLLENTTEIPTTWSIESNFSSRTYPALRYFKGSIDIDYIEQTNSFWLQFEPASVKTHYVIAVIYLFITIIGCCGNAFVIFMFIRCKSLRTSANILVFNLAVSDFLMVSKGPIAIYNSINFGPALGDIGCRLYGFIGGLSGTVSIMTLSAISIDRYRVVVYPLHPLRSAPKYRSIVMIVIVWLYSFTFSIIPALNIGLSHYVPEGLLTTCSFDYLSKSLKAKIFMFTFFIAAWCIPFFTIVYCYIYILKVVASANLIRSSKDQNKTELKLTSVVFGVISLWFLSWTPYAIVALLGITGNEHMITPLLSMVPAIFCKSSACINPYVYAMTHPRFKMECSRLFGTKNIRRISVTRRSSAFSMTRNLTVKRQKSVYRGSLDEYRSNMSFENGHPEQNKMVDDNYCEFVEIARKDSLFLQNQQLMNKETNQL